MSRIGLLIKWRRCGPAAAYCPRAPSLDHQCRWNNWFRVSLRSPFSLINGAARQAGRPACCLSSPPNTRLQSGQPRSYINRRLASIHQLPSDVLTNDLLAVKAISRRFDHVFLVAKMSAAATAVTAVHWWNRLASWPRTGRQSSSCTKKCPTSGVW